MTRLLLCFFLLTTSTLHASPRWYWQDHFTREQQNMLTHWIEEADAGVRNLFGPLPYSYNVYFHQLDGNEPVPWAHTTKGFTKSVHFYVSLRYSQRQFIQDWTAYHELAHLLFPYIGENSTWFSEGIASYLQYQIMYAKDVITWRQGVNRLQERFRRARSYRNYDSISIEELSKILRQTGAYVRLYWGGAAYFANVDMRLHQEKGIRLNNVIHSYLQCCSSQRIRGARNMIRLFDRISNSRIFSEVYADTVTNTGFPETRQAVSWLRNQPPPLYGR